MIQFKPIGTVRNDMTEAHHDTVWSTIESEIVLDEAWRDALDGLDQFSHIWVIFNFHRIGPVQALRVRPMRREWLPLVGLFATRAPARPNPIGISAVALLKVDGCRLVVRGLEALSGTPVLDIKPYLERGDAIRGTRTGEWVTRFWSTLPPESP